MKILYVHGYNGNPYGESFSHLKAICDKVGYEIVSLDYDETKIGETINEIYQTYVDQNIDIVVGASYGGFIVMNCFDLPRIVVNPCLKPIDELPKIGVSADIDFLEFYQNRITKYFDHEDFDMCLGLFCEDDELLGIKYKESFDKSFKTSKIIPGTHHINEDSAKYIIDEIKNFETLK